MTSEWALCPLLQLNGSSVGRGMVPSQVDSAGLKQSLGPMSEAHSSFGAVHMVFGAGTTSLCGWDPRSRETQWSLGAWCLPEVPPPLLSPTKVPVSSTSCAFSPGLLFQPESPLGEGGFA